MTKKLLALALAFCLCVSLGAGAFASGEAGGSGEGSGGPPGGSSASYLYEVTAEGVAVLASGSSDLSVPFDPAGISGFEVSSSSDGLVAVIGDDTTEGAVSFTLGGDGEMFDAKDLEIYAGAQEKLGFSAFDSRADMGGMPLASARGGAYLELDGIHAVGQTGLLTVGSDADRYSGADDSAYIDTVVVVRDSYLESENAMPINEVRWPHGTTLMVRGANRTALSVGESETYYYGSAVVVDGWAAMATDSAVGMGLDMVAYNSYAAARLGGYCSYSDSRCRDFLYGTTYESAEYGSIIANFGELYILGTDDAALDTNTIRSASGGTELAERAPIDPLAYAEAGDIVSENIPSDVAGFRNAVMMHVPDIMGGGAKISDAKGILYVKGSTIATREDLAPADYDTGEYTQSWISNVGEANYAYLEYTRGAAVLIRSDNALIHLTDANVESYTGVLIQSVLNADANGNWIPADASVTDRIGIDVIADGTTALTGSINHEDYHRVMNITLADDASLTGDIFTGTVDTWHEKFAGYLDSGANFLRDLDGYDTVWGTNVTLQDNAVWTVTERSNITGLTVEPGAVLNAVVTVDGSEVDASAGGSWQGDIVLTPAVSGEGSGEMLQAALDTLLPAVSSISDQVSEFAQSQEGEEILGTLSGLLGMLLGQGDSGYGGDDEDYSLEVPASVAALTDEENALLNGTLKDGVYENGYFGIRFTLPEGGTLVRYNDDAEGALPLMPLSQTYDDGWGGYYLMAHMPGVDGYISIYITALEGDEAGLTEEQLTRKRIEDDWAFNAAFDDDSGPDFDTTLFAGEEHPLSVEIIETEDGPAVHANIYLVRGDFLHSITFYAVNGELEDLLTYFDKL